jgi:hypothetical protein
MLLVARSTMRQGQLRHDEPQREDASTTHQLWEDLLRKLTMRALLASLHCRHSYGLKAV